MSKSWKKILVTSASLLMLASAGASLSNTTHASEASAFNKLTGILGNDKYTKTFQAGADEGYTINHNGKRITVTMTHAYINGRRVSFSKALRTFEQKAHKSYAKRHYRKAKRIRIRKPHKANVRRAKKARRNRRTKRIKHVIRKHTKKYRKRSIKRQARLTPRQRHIINGAKYNHKIISHISMGELMDLETDNPTTPREYKEFKALNQNEQYEKEAKKAFTPRQYKRIAYLFE